MARRAGREGLSAMAGVYRRWVLGLGLVLAVLLIGRWGAVFLTDRLWEASISESGAVVGTRWALLAGGLELSGVIIACLWFVVHLIAAAKLIMSGERETFGSGSWPSGAARWALVGVGLVLGVATGSGGGQWLAPILLSLRGVRYGVTDPLLGEDLGLYVSRLPLWQLLREQALSLIFPALLAVLAFHLLGGTLRIVNRRLWLAPRGRWQFGILLVGLALVIGWGRALVPYELAAGSAGVLTPSAFLLQTTVAQLQAVFAATAAVLTFVWTVRGRFVLALGGWVALGLAMLGGEILVSSRDEERPLGRSELAELRRIDTVAFGLRTERPSHPAPPPLRRLSPSLWDAGVVTRLAEADSSRVVYLSPGALVVGGDSVRVWFLLRRTPRGEFVLSAMADDRTGPAGGPVSIRFGDTLFSPGLVAYRPVGPHDLHPGQRLPDIGPEAVGVPLWSAGRRLVTAWALQSFKVLKAHREDRIGWLLDPVDRLTKVAPFAEWSQPRVRWLDGEQMWESDGFLVSDAFPSSRAVRWRGRTAGRVRVAFLGLVAARSGTVRVFLRADGDSLAQAWSELAAPLVEPPERIPAGMGALSYPAEEFAVHAEVLSGPAWFGQALARLGRSPYPLAAIPALLTAEDPGTVPFVTEQGREVNRLALGQGGGEPPWIASVVSDSTRRVGTPAELGQRWELMPFFQQVRDSIRAAGADVVAGAVRYGTLGDTLTAYQPTYAVGSTGRASLAVVVLAAGSRQGVGRTLDEAWRSLRGELALLSVGRELEARLTEARLWLERADEALRKGDLQEFGRAFGFLREILESAPGERGGSNQK